MPKHENNALQKNFTINLKRLLFLSSVSQASGMKYAWPVN